MRSVLARSIVARPATASSVPLVVMLSFVNLEKLPSAVLASPAADSSVVVDTLVLPPVPLPTAEDSALMEARLSQAELRRPLERYFARFNRDTVLVRRVARAVLREAERQQVAASLVAAVLVTENTTLKPAAESSVGARGLMQVMPMHAGRLGCASDDLVDVDSNICHGTTILARNLKRSASTSQALLRYNGCVKGTNTPDCHRYPGKVLARAGRVRQELLAGAGPAASALALAR